MLVATLLVALQVAAPTPDPPPAPRPSSGTASLDILTDDRQSLAGVGRLLLSLHVPDDLADAIETDVLRSTVAFSLGQAGLEVIASRQVVDDPTLVIALRVVPDVVPAGGQPRKLYRVDADLFQLVRIPDHDGGTRLMMASTWHAGSFGAVDDIALSTLRDRVADVVDAFVSDWSGANTP